MILKFYSIHTISYYYPIHTTYYTLQDFYKFTNRRTRTLARDTLNLILLRDLQGLKACSLGYRYSNMDKENETMSRHLMLRILKPRQ